MNSKILDSLFDKLARAREAVEPSPLEVSSSDTENCNLALHPLVAAVLRPAADSCQARDALETPGGLLDLRDASPQTRRVFSEWLLFQHELVLRPVLALQALRHNRNPLQALRALGIEPAALPPLAPATLEILAQRSIVGIPYLSPAYPKRLQRLVDAAPLLLCRGNPELLHKPSVAIVGARAASVYGRSAARELAREAARAGLVVISGLARGIDAEAHRGALDVGGETIAVLGCGLDRIYPAEHRALSEEILARGALLSELPLGSAPKRLHFPLRNRLISGLSHAVVVVEAREKSGSLITVSHALEQGVDVLVVPGPITSATSAGSNRLLRDGAIPLLDVSDLLALFPTLKKNDTRPTKAAIDSEAAISNLPEQTKTAPEFSALQRSVLAELERGALTADALGRKLGCAPETLAQELVALELEGLVATDRNGLLALVAQLR